MNEATKKATVFSKQCAPIKNATSADCDFINTNKTLPDRRSKLVFVVFCYSFAVMNNNRQDKRLMSKYNNISKAKHAVKGGIGDFIIVLYSLLILLHSVKTDDLIIKEM